MPKKGTFVTNLTSWVSVLGPVSLILALRSIACVLGSQIVGSESCVRNSRFRVWIYSVNRTKCDKIYYKMWQVLPTFSFYLGHWQVTWLQGKKEDHICFSRSPLPAHEYLDINMQLCRWDDITAPHVTTRLVFDKIYPMESSI